MSIIVPILNALMHNTIMESVETTELELLQQQCDAAEMATIVDKNLKEMIQNKAVRSLRVTRVENGYTVHVLLMWKQEEVVLVTQRGAVRTWKSLDRLADHLASFKAELPPISLYP